MTKWLVLTYCLLSYANIYSQNPPAQLPSLLDNNEVKIPVLHKGEDPKDIIRKKIFAKVETDRKSVFAGESFAVAYKLYTALSSQARVSRQPLFSGCSVLELAAPSEPEVVIMAGIPWHVFTIRKVQVIPLEEGYLELGKVYVDNVVQLLKEDGLNIENFSLQVSNDPVRIEVKALPAKGKPRYFTGMIGDYTINANVDSGSITTGENATLKITISGTGNIGGIRLPYIDWPSGTEHFEGTDTQFVNLDNFPVKGHKTFEISFIGTKEGKVEIPPVKFSFFDPEKKLYKTVSAKSIPVTFTKAVSRQEQFAEIVTEDVSNKKYLWIVVAIAAAVITTWFISSVVKKRNGNPAKPIHINTTPVINSTAGTPSPSTDPSDIFEALNHLGTIEKKEEFLVQTKILLTKTLQQKTASVSVIEEVLIKELRSNEQLAQYTTACEKIYIECNRSLYAPFPEDDLKEKIYFDLTAVIKQLNRNNQSVNL